MTQLTKEQWLRLGGGAIAVLRKHGSDAADLLTDIPKAISLAKDMVAMVNNVQTMEQPVKASTVPPSPAKSATIKVTQPDLFTEPKVTADSVIKHVETHGLSDSERAIMDRASQVVG